MVSSAVRSGSVNSVKEGFISEFEIGGVVIGVDEPVGVGDDGSDEMDTPRISARAAGDWAASRFEFRCF